jgi:hypothetical protein
MEHYWGRCKNLDTYFGFWTLDAGFCIIGLYRLDSTLAAGPKISVWQNFKVMCSKADITSV